MTGLLLIAVLLIWIAACAWLVQKIGNLLPDRPWRAVVKFAMFVVLLPLPLIDEIIAKPQFEALCREKAVLILDDPHPTGRIVWYGSGVRTEVPIGLLRAVVHRKVYVETATNQPVYHYHTVTATGGFLMRALGISETTSPLVFSSFCAPSQISNMSTWRQTYGLTEIPRPISK